MLAVRSVPRLAGALVVGWAAFAYRFLTPGFHNDHFEHLSMARQVLFGEWPGRDFFDPGRPLTVLLSAAAQWWPGPTLLSEALLAIGGLASGAAIVFWLVSGATRSSAIGVLSACLVILIAPRLYSYPKVLVFAVALLAVWTYIDRPSRVRLAVMALATVFAFLMRHDFGVYVGVTAVVTLVWLHRRAAIPPLAAYMVVGAAAVAPYLGWLSRHDLLAGPGASGAASLVDAAQVTWRPLRLDLSNGLVHLNPVLAQVVVRWVPGVDPVVRESLERRYGLTGAVVEGEHTYGYGLTDASRANLRALVNDSSVVDTGGIVRGAAVLDVPIWERWTITLGLSRIVWGPFFSASDAEAWLYYFFWIIALVALILAWRLPSGRRASEGAKIGSAATLGVLLNLFLIRGSLDSRLPDVVIPAAIAGGYLLWRGVRRARHGPWAGRIAAAIGIAGCLLLFWAALTTYERSASLARLATAVFRFDRLRTAASELGRRPIEARELPGSPSVVYLTRYLHACTAPGDRVLLVAYEPQVFYFSERLFAGGMAYFHQRRFSSEPEQAMIVRRLERERVPVVIIEEERLRMLQDDYPQVYRHVTTQYVDAARTAFGDDRQWRVLVDPKLEPMSTRDTLPCYAASS